MEKETENKMKIGNDYYINMTGLPIRLNGILYYAEEADRIEILPFDRYVRTDESGWDIYAVDYREIKGYHASHTDFPNEQDGVKYLVSKGAIKRLREYGIQRHDLLTANLKKIDGVYEYEIEHLMDETPFPFRPEPK